MGRDQLLALGISVPENYDTPPRLRAGLNPFVARAQASLRTAQGTLPQRALSTSIVQIAENLLGGREGPLQRLAQVQNRLGDVNALADRGQVLRAAQVQAYIPFRAAREQIRGLNATGAPIPTELARGAAQLTKEFQGLQKQSAKNSTALKIASEDVERLAKTAVTGGDVLRNLAAGAVGGVAGGLVAGAVAQVGQVAIQGAVAALGPLIEKMTGFQGTTARVTGALSDATRASSGNVRAVVANAAAQTGLSKANYDALSPAIAQRTAIEAGNKNLTDQVDLLRASQNITRGGQSGPLGFLQPGGGIPGLSRSTGGFLGSDFGATPSTLETVTGQLPGRDSISQAMPFFAYTANNLLGGLPGLLSASNSQNELASPEGQQTLKFFNNQLEKAGSSLKLLSNATDAQIGATREALKQAGATADQIDQFTRDRLAIVGANGAPIAPGQGTQFLTQLNQGSVMPDPDLMLESMRGQIQATARQIQRELAQGLSNNQAAAALNNLAQPPAPLGRGILSPNAPQSVRDRIASRQGEYDTAVGRNLAYGEPGEAFLDKLKVPQSLRQDLADVGRQIDDITGKMAQRQADNFWVDYNHNVDLAKRSVSDLVGLAGKTSVSVGGEAIGASKVGQREAQNLALSRESQLLGFNQQQNALNLQTALAGFGTQGLTGEERAARMEQAKKEAAIQQRQLDIGRTVAGNQYANTKEINERSLSDAEFQLNSLFRQRDLVVDIQIDQQQMAELEKTRQNILADIGSYTAAGNAAISAESQFITQFETATGTILTNVEKIAKAFEDAFGPVPKGDGSAGGFNAGNPGTGQQGQGRGPAFDPTANAESRGRDTGGPGNVTPASGAAIVVQINGGNFTDEQSRQGLIRDVATAVQTGMDRKASLIGLRTPR
jgi:hypothetical protein